jgi:hypothetical protein
LSDKLSESGHHFGLRFSDKSAWNEFKEDLKPLLREQAIKFQYSEKSPTFHILYKNPEISFKVIWEDDGGLLVTLQASSEITEESVMVCGEIFELLQLFSGELVKGESPYNWGSSSSVSLTEIPGLSICEKHHRNTLN